MFTRDKAAVLGLWKLLVQYIGIDRKWTHPGARSDERRINARNQDRNNL